MPHFEAFNLVAWMHFVSLSVAGGAAVAALLLSGFEDTREDLRGLAAVLWSRVVRWAARIAVLIGIGLVGMYQHMGVSFTQLRYLWIKLPLALAFLALSEMAPRALGAGKRGAAMLALLLFLASSFVVHQRAAFAAFMSPAPGSAETK